MPSQGEEAYLGRYVAIGGQLACRGDHIMANIQLFSILLKGFYERPDP